MRREMKRIQCLQGLREIVKKTVMRHSAWIRLCRLEAWERRLDRKKTQRLVRDLAQGGSVRSADTPPGEGGIERAGRGGASSTMDSRK